MTSQIFELYKKIVKDKVELLFKEIPLYLLMSFLGYAYYKKKIMTPQE